MCAHDPPAELQSISDTACELAALNDWLERLPRAAGRSLVVSRYAERVGWSEAGAAGMMARLLADSSASHELAELLMLELGWSRQRVMDELASMRQPTVNTQQRGKFGEVLHAAILEEFDDMDILIMRYRYILAPNAPLHGPDIVALGRIGSDDAGDERIFVAETKLRNAGGRAALSEAYDQLSKTDKGLLGTFLAGYMEILQDADRDLLRRLLRAIEREDPVHFRIGVIVESSQWSDSHLDGVDRRSADDDLDMAVDVVTIGMLDDLVRESYIGVNALG